MALRGNRRYAFALLMAVALLLGGCDSGAPKQAFQLTDISGAEFGRNFKLTDHNGKTRTLDDFKDKVVAVFFGYIFCPDVCPTTMGDLALVMKELGADAVEGRQLGERFDFGLGEDLGVEDAGLHFELGEVLEEGDEDLGDARGVLAAGHEGRVAREVLREVRELRLLGGDAEDAVLDDVVLGAVLTELVTHLGGVFDGHAGEVRDQEVVRAGQLGGHFVDEELFFSAHVRVVSGSVTG